MSKCKVVITHGSFGDTQENWIPYLRDNLASLGFNVITPQFPIGETQNLQNWTETFKNEVGELDQNTILVGHSIAPAFFMSLLSNVDIKVKAIILVSGFLHDLGVEEFDNVNHSFTHAEFDWEKIKNNFKYGHSFHGIDDPYVPLWMGEELATNLEIELTPIEKGGHLNIAAGFKEFPELLNKIKEMV